MQKTRSPFYEADARSPDDRVPETGFRCADYPTGEGSSAERLERPVEFDVLAPDLTPVSDELFEAYRSLYACDAAPLRPTVERTDESSEYWVRQWISFDAAYGGERMIIHVFLPRNITAPYQAVVYWPYSKAMLLPSSDSIAFMRDVDFIVKSGRALVYPVYKGTYERNPGGVRTWIPDTTRFYANHIIEAVQDLRRSMDYVATRSDLDAGRIAFFGTSWGAIVGAIPLAIEKRFVASILTSGGLAPMRSRPEVEPYNFAPRVRQPLLVINGKYDLLFPLETNQRPMFEMLGTPAADKRHIVYDAGHDVVSWRAEQVRRDILDWLDTYLGPVR